MASAQKLPGSNTNTELYGYTGNIKVTITEQALAEGAAEFEEELAKRDAEKAEEAKKQAEKDKEASKTDKEQSSNPAV